MIGHLYTLLFVGVQSAPPDPDPEPETDPGVQSGGGSGGGGYGRPMAYRAPVSMLPPDRHTRKQKRMVALLVAGAL